jgi:dynein heavy chain
LLLASTEKFKESPILIRLFAHEVNRVFGDRLIDDNDRSWLFFKVKDLTAKHFNLKFDEVFAHLDSNDDGKIDEDDLRSLMFGDFLTPSANISLYDEARDINAVSAIIKTKLEDYNLISKAPMNLVIFRFAVEHISRISRILKQPAGHALLVGVGGSGRQSLTKLAASMAELTLFQVEITKSYALMDWREDLKKMLKTAGGEGKPTVFLFSDSQLKMEAFLEDMNNILNTGEVPNIFEMDEKALVIDMVRTSILKDDPKSEANPTFIYNQFVSRCKENLHIVFCMSPIGDAFRNRLRMFPALVNCCTIDWFQVWPEDALDMVATKFLEDVQLEPEVRNNVIKMCKNFHVGTRNLSLKYYETLRRHNYVTPTSYLELIQTYKQLINSKRVEVGGLKVRYEVGLEQLANASYQVGTEIIMVGTMQIELNDLQPKLIETKRETQEMMVVIKSESIEVDKKRALVKIDEEVANKKAGEAKAIKDDCEADLAEAIPALEAAMEALDTLKPADITNVKALKNPPPAVRLVMEAVCVMKQVKPVRIKDPNGSGKMIDDYWAPSVKLLGDSHFLQSLKAYDKDNIDPIVIANIRKKFIPNPDFVPEIVKNSSSAAEGLCKWVRALDKYDIVAKVVGPKKESLAKAEVYMF